MINNIRSKATKLCLNRYPSEPRLRIETRSNGDCVWRAVVTKFEMERTKRYLERIWKY